MLNYHTDIFFKIDIILLGLYLISSAALILYIIVRDHRSEKRAQKLLEIKHSLSKLFLSGKNINTATCPLSAGITTPAEFLDVETNRQKHAVFFNESEQQLFKECVISPDKLKTFESIAKKQTNKWLRIEAITALGYAKADSALDTLEQLLYSKDADISYFSTLAIGQISTMRSAGILMAFLKNNPSARRKTASILESMSPDITDEAIKFADDPDPEIRLWAVKLLSKSVSRQYINKVEELTEDTSPEVRATACESLAKLHDKDSKKLLIARLKDENWHVRAQAVIAMSEIFHEEAIPEIMGLINDGSISVLNSVKKVLADNIKAALPYMDKVFSGTDELAKKICIEAMESAGLKKS